MCAKGSRERGDEKRGRRQRKYYSTLADLDAHGGGGPGTAPLIPLSRASPGQLGPDFPLSPFQMRRFRLLWQLCIIQPASPLLPSPTPQTLGRLQLALYLTAGCSPCLRLEIVVALIVGSVSGRVASAHSVE